MKESDELISVFSLALGVDKKIIIDDLEYNTIPEWDSVAHMALVADLEDAFDIMLDTDDILDMSSVRKAKEILAKHEVTFS